MGFIGVGKTKMRAIIMYIFIIILSVSAALKIAETRNINPVGVHSEVIWREVDKLTTIVTVREMLAAIRISVGEFWIYSHDADKLNARIEESKRFHKFLVSGIHEITGLNVDEALQYAEQFYKAIEYISDAMLNEDFEKAFFVLEKRVHPNLLGDSTRIR